LPIGVVTGAQGQRWYEITVDFRHPEDAVLTQMDRELRQACEGTASAIGLEVEVKEFWYFPPTPFHPDLVAGHDAVYMARVAPSVMVFVPCVGGISHNEIEDAKPEDLTAGCNVLLNAVLDRANAV
jgi:beta-ureidopropionase / N-carbamoyl-L-amino-acid hydrolase